MKYEIRPAAGQVWTKNRGESGAYIEVCEHFDRDFSSKACPSMLLAGDGRRWAWPEEPELLHENK